MHYEFMNFEIKAHWGEPHIDHDKGSPTWNNGTCIYISMYHLPHICCTLVPEICVRPEMLRAFQYIDVLTCMIYT